MFLLRTLLARASQNGETAVFHVHPWEFDPDPPKAPGVSWRERFIHYRGLGRTEKRLENLLSAFHFTSVFRGLEKGGWLS